MVKSRDPENINMILVLSMRELTHSAIASELGLHRQTVKKIVESEAYQKLVAETEERLLSEQSERSSERRRKNGVILKAYQMSHPYRDQVLETARKIADEKYPEPGEHISVEIEDIDNFCKDLNIDF